MVLNRTKKHGSMDQLSVRRPRPPFARRANMTVTIIASGTRNRTNDPYPFGFAFISSITRRAVNQNAPHMAAIWMHKRPLSVPSILSRACSVIP